MPRVLLKMLAPTHLKDPHLGVTPMGQYRGKDRGPVQMWRTNTDLSAVTDRQNLGERDLLANFDGQRFYLDPVPRVDSILFAARLDYREHRPIPAHRGPSGLVESRKLSPLSRIRVNRVVF